MLRALAPSMDRIRGPLVASGTIGVFAVALVGVLKLGLPIWSLLIVVAVLAYGFVTVHKPVIGLIAVICVFFVPVRLAAGVSLLQVVGAGTAALIMVWFLYGRRRIVFSTIQIPLVLLGILIVTSIWFSLDAAKTTFYTRRWVFNMLFVLLMLNLVTTFSILKRIVWSVMIMAAANAVFGMFDYSRASDFNYRSMGLMENANSFGHLAALAFPLALYQYLYREGTVRVAGFILTGCLFGGVVASVSRGALLSVLFIVTVTLIRERRRTIPLLIVVALGIASTPFLPEYYRERVGNLVDDVKNSLAVKQDRGLTSRGSLNSAGLKIWWDHPIVGVGIGNFGRYYVQSDYVAELQGSENIIAHNIYIQALAEMGIIGTIVLLWLLFGSARGIWLARRSTVRGSPEWIYFGAMEMMVLAIFVSTASYGNLMSNDFWLFVALTAASARVAVAGTTRPQLPAPEATT